MDPTRRRGSTRALPRGEGPVGLTLCGTPGTIAAGDYELVVATFGDDIPLDYAYSYFQHAVVFDADGDTDNNYEPPLQYVDDFFGGSDMWFQLFYDPALGFSLKVVDARISTSNPVSSNARMVIAGRELRPHPARRAERHRPRRPRHHLPPRERLRPRRRPVGCVVSSPAR